MNYNLQEPPQPKIRALKFSSPDECSIYLWDYNGGEGMGGPFLGNAQYSFDGQTWNDWDGGYYSGEYISFGNGVDLYIRGNNPNGWSDGNSMNCFGANGSNISVEGNIMHLLSYTEDLSAIPCGGCFAYLFGDCSSIVNVSKLELPSTTLALSCYASMFANCTSLVNAPELPVTTLVESCYMAMFDGCTSLVNAPELPATTLAEYCYYNMFNGCTSLVDAPELPATTLYSECYEYMFEGCSKLNHIKMMATDISASQCLYNWVNRVSSTGTFECASGMSTKIPSGTKGIPSGWTVTEVAA